MRRAPLRSLSTALTAILTAAAVFLFLAPTGRNDVVVTDVRLTSVPALNSDFGVDFSEAVQTILSRPLFVQGRSAVTDEGGDSAALGEFRLAGTIANLRVRKALFAEAGSASVQRKGRWLAIGEEIAGWRVESIEAGRAVLTRGGERATLSISKRRAMTEKEASQARAATPILSTAAASTSRNAVDVRAKTIEDALSTIDASDFYGTPK
jgi:hypothetical protein